MFTTDVWATAVAFLRIKYSIIIIRSTYVSPEKLLTGGLI